MCSVRLIPIFVYGTLIPMAETIASSSIEQDVIEGYILKDLGAFPAVVKGEGEIKGLFMYVSESMLSELDRYEGNLYKKEEVVTKGGRPTNVYVWVDPTTIEKYPIIEDGDWAKSRSI